MEHKEKKDWCSGFSEYWFGTYIGDCCKGHDSDCKTKPFFKCLKDTAGYFCAVLVASGGTIGCVVKYDILRMKFKPPTEEQRCSK